MEGLLSFEELEPSAVDSIAIAPPLKKKKNQQQTETKQPQQKKELPAMSEEDLKDLLEWKQLQIDDKILYAIKYKDFQHPTPIQTASIQAALTAKKDIVGASPTVTIY